MNNCLKEQDLTLLYYGELAESSHQAQHINKCSGCREKLAKLSHELDRLPRLNVSVHPATATRMAARVNEHLQRPKRRWMPNTGTLVVSACALIATLIVWSPQQELPQTTQLTVTTSASLSLEEQMPDIDFLEDMDLLMELDLISQVEGV